MPQPSIEFYNEALDHLEAGNAPEALAAIVNSLTEDPSDTQTWQLYIVILNALGRSDDAARAMAKLKEKGLSKAGEALLRAAESVTSGDLSAALSHYEDALAAEPDRSDVHASHALALMQQGNAPAALVAAEKAVTAGPDDAHAHYALGHILRLSGRTDEALAALTHAVTLDPELMLAVYEQGMLLAGNGRFSEALANFEKFLATHPGDPGAAQAIQSIRERMSSSQ